MVDLPEGIDDATLQTIFSAYGTVQTLKVLPNPKGGKCAAMIRFQSVDEATWIVENLNGNIPQGLAEAIQVRYANPPGQKGGMKGGCDGGMKGGCDGGKGDGGFGGCDGGGMKGGCAGGWKGDGGFGKAAGKGWGSFDGGKGLDAGKGKGDSWSEPYPSWGCGKGKFGKGKGKGCSIKVLHEGLIEAQALPGCDKMSNNHNALYISGLPTDTQDVDLYRIFAPFGAVQPKGVRAMSHPDGSCTGIGFVNFLEPSAMQLAITTLNGTQMPDGSTMNVQPKKG